MAVYKNMLVVFFVIATINLCLAKTKWIWQRDDFAEDLDVERRPKMQRDVEKDGIQDEILHRQMKKKRVVPSQDQVVN
ncbi:Hypothetical predicted protein [Paramuricea clavata]|uniref:Uncharacterized protein n=1 Tax=Paramuricea clavata TaxID=317549 RepID=A0A7D9EP96_PARCT|nr:Hypothetical predicted protein [Paramuricea clavata]